MSLCIWLDLSNERSTKEDFSASGLLSLFSFSALPSEIELISSKSEFECVVRYSILLGASLIPFGNTSFCICCLRLKFALSHKISMLEHNSSERFM